MAEDFTEPLSGAPLTAPPPAPLPSAEDVLGPRGQLPSAEAVLGPRPVNTNALALGGADMDQYFSQGSAGRILDLMGQGARDGWGTQPLGLAPETIAGLGLTPEAGKMQTSLIRNFNEWLLRPAAIGADAMLRAPGAAIRAISEPLVQGGVPADLTPQALFEAFPLGHVTGLPVAIPAMERAADLGVVGKGEAGYQDLAAATDAATAALRPTGVESPTERVVPPGQVTIESIDAEPLGAPFRPGEAAETGAAPEPPDVHAMARQVAPDTMGEFDALSGRKAVFTRWIDELAETRSADPRVAAAQAAIDTILDKVGGDEDRLTKAQRGRLEQTRGDLAAFLGTDTPDMARVRQDLQATNAQLMALAPAVHDAYRQAAEMVPQEPVSAPTAPEAAPTSAETVPTVAPEAAGAAETTPAATPAPETAPTAPAPPDAISAAVEPPAEQPAAAPAAAAPLPAATVATAPAVDLKVNTESPAAPARALPAGGIAEDVAQNLTSAGRPQEEADAAGALVQSHYEARAERFAGAKGSAEDLYLADAPAVRAGRGVRAVEYAQKGDTRVAPTGEPPVELNQTQRGKIRLQTATARGTITLFKDADASTFIHETGHHWLEELMADAADERAPAELRADAATVRTWLGTQEGAAIPTRAHEKFARGFERYMMEGHAPSAGLAQVFAKFRDWLVRIYHTVDKLRSPINDDIRGVFDRLAATKDEGTVVAPDREGAGMTMSGEPGRELRELVDRTSARPGAAGAYEPVPKEPMRLVDFLKKSGGLNDDTFSRRVNNARGRFAARRNPSDIPSIADHPRAKGLLRPRTGMRHDDATLKAWEAGYMPEHAERPAIDDLYTAIGQDLDSAPPRYAAEDELAAQAYHDAIARNSAIGQLADRLGIDARDYTPQEFADMAAEHMSLEDQAHEIGSQEAAADREFAELERKAQEARGDAWEPDAEDATASPRTLEDLERAYEQERAAAAGARESEALPGEDGPPAGDQDSREAGARPPEPGSGAARRTGARPGEAPARDVPTGPHAAFAPLDDGLIDKAGNIRLDNLNQPDDIDAVIREAAARNGDFNAERRGVITDGQLLDLADALGRDPAFLDRKKIGDAFSPEEILAARKLLVQSAAAVRDAMTKAAGGAEADVVALAKAIARHEMIQGKVAQATAEWGRAGRAFRALDGWDGVRDLNQMLKENGGRSLSQLGEMAQLGRTLKTPGQVSKFIADTAGGRIKRAILFYYVNALISGPITHLRYSVGNAINTLWQPLVETPIAAGYGAAREALGYDGRVARAAGELPIGEDLPSRVYLAEAGAQLYGLGKGFRDGLGGALEAWRTGASPALPGERIPEQFTGQQVPPIPGTIGRTIAVPGKAVAAIHSFFKAIRYEQQIQTLAVRDAMARGLEGDARDLRIAQLTESPTPDMMADASAHALKELYMRPAEFDSGMAGLIRFSNRYVLAKVFLPFLRIGSEITRNALVERTPLGIATAEVRGNLLGRQGGAAFDAQAAKITAGVGLMAATAIAVAEGAVTGDGPIDPAKRRVWLLNHMPNTIQIGGIRIPYAGIGHLGMLMRFAADMTETAAGWDGEDGGKLAVAFTEGISRSILDETFMRGAKDVLDAIYHPEENGPRFIQNFATNWLPFSVGAAQVAHEIDPYRRETHGIFEAAWNHLPVLSQSLFPQRDMFGEPIPSGGGIERYAGDPTVRAMNDLQIGVGQIDKKIRGVQLTEQQFDDYSRIAGRYAKMKLDAMIQGGGAGFAAMPAAIRISQIKKQIEDAQESARGLVALQSVGTSNDIWKLATEAKAAALKPPQPAQTVH